MVHYQYPKDVTVFKIKIYAFNQRTIPNDLSSIKEPETTKDLIGALIKPFTASQEAMLKDTAFARGARMIVAFEYGKPFYWGMVQG